MNCAGGSIEGMKWLSCEETSTGQVYECDLMVIILQKSFRHLVALNMRLLLRIFEKHLYLTEDIQMVGFTVSFRQSY